MGWKKMFIGEKMPDKDDPQYRQRYENEVKAGRKFAKTMKLDVLAAKVQLFANDLPCIWFHNLLFWSEHLQDGSGVWSSTVKTKCYGKARADVASATQQSLESC